MEFIFHHTRYKRSKRAWTETCQVAFKKLKELLLNLPLLAHCDPNNQFGWLSTPHHMVWGQSCHMSLMTVKKNQSCMHPAVSQQVSKIIQ